MRIRPARRSPGKTALAVLPLAVLLLGAACGGGTRPASPPAGRGHVVPPAQSEVFPEAGVIVAQTTAARAAPNRRAHVLATLHQFRPDNRPTIVFAVGSTRDRSGHAWYHIDLPGPSNTRQGWIVAGSVQLHPVRTRIAIDVSARTLRVYVDGRLRLRTRVAVGRPGMATPIGNFYVRAGYRATELALGDYAFETSAYSKLSDWPGGGIIGIHGTPQPQLLGTAVSHGCVRVSNAAARRLRSLVPVGTAISIAR